MGRLRDIRVTNTPANPVESMTIIVALILAALISGAGSSRAERIYDCTPPIHQFPCDAGSRQKLFVDGHAH